MTSERDFDRLARAWLELGPDEAPDRVIATVLQAADTMPQVRRRVAWPIWRSFTMNRSSWPPARWPSSSSSSAAGS